MKRFRKKLRKSNNCLNCGRELEDFNYCPDCGQINTHKQVSLRQILKDLLGDYFTFDSKFIRSFVPLIKQPGRLTTEYIVGRRVTYILPMRLFVFTTALFFFMLALTSTNSDSDGFQSEKIKNPTDTLSAIFDKYKNSIPEETSALIIDDLTTRYDVYTTTRSFSSKQLRLIEEIKKYNLNCSEEEEQYFVLKLLSDYRLRNKKFDSFTFEIDDEDEIGEDSLATKIKKETFKKINNNLNNISDQIDIKNKDELENYDSLKIFIKKYAPKDLNRENRFYNFIASNYKIEKRNKRSRNGYRNFRLFGSDTSNSAFVKKIETQAEKLSNAGSFGTKVFTMQFMNQMPKLVFCMVPILALLLKLFYVRSKIFYINHLIFSLHLHSVMLIVLLFPLLFGYLNLGALVVSLTSVIIAIGFYIYAFKALKRVYQQKGVKTFLKINFAILIYLIFFSIGFSAAGLYTLYVF